MRWLGGFRVSRSRMARLESAQGVVRINGGWWRSPSGNCLRVNRVQLGLMSPGELTEFSKVEATKRERWRLIP